MSVPQAAQALGLTEGAVRQRIQRGTLEHEKGDDGRVYVLVRRETEGQNTVSTDSSSEAVDILREQNEWLRREVERKDAIILSLTQRVPELEPAPDERNAPVSASEEPGRGTGTPGTGEAVYGGGDEASPLVAALVRGRVRMMCSGWKRVPDPPHPIPA